MSYYVYMLKSVSRKPVTYVGYTKILQTESNYIILVKELNSQEDVNGG